MVHDKRTFVFEVCLLGTKKFIIKELVFALICNLLLILILIIYSVTTIID